jgi:hypothetical protein
MEEGPMPERNQTLHSANVAVSTVKFRLAGPVCGEDGRAVRIGAGFTIRRLGSPIVPSSVDARRGRLGGYPGPGTER